MLTTEADMAAVVRVAVGVVQDAAGRVLIARRPDHVHQGGLWEFPGGKVDEGETLTHALTRELEEELAIRVREAESLIDIRHHYPDKSVWLQVCRVTCFEGEPQGNEGQPVRWVSPEALLDYDFPAANRPIVNAIRLPSQWVITGPSLSEDDWMERLQEALRRGARALILRAPELSVEQYRHRARQALALCQAFDARLLAHGPEAHCDEALGGWHMNGEALARCSQRPVPPSRWWGASCHSPGELARAVELGVDYVTLSPVNVTESHPDVAPLGWRQFAQWVADAPLPVYALGGMAAQDLEQAKASGAQGIAGIGFGWPLFNSLSNNQSRPLGRE